MKAYYLHENGNLIYKAHAEVCDLRDSDLVKMYWEFDETSRLCAWNMLVEALTIGANKKKIFELADKWNCNNEDAKKYADFLGIVLSKDGTAFQVNLTNFINIQESPVGFGDTYLEAFSELCKALGFKYTKLNWHATFEQLCKKPIEENKKI